MAVSSSEQPHDPPRRSPRREATRSRLLAAALEVFAERGFGRATVEDVCDCAGFTRGAFYSNFATLDELFFALYTDHAREVIGAVESAVQSAVEEAMGTTRATPLLTDVVDRAVAALPVSRQHHLITTDFTAHALRNPDVATSLAEHRRQLRLALLPALRQAVVTQGTPEPDDAALDNLARALIAVHDGMLSQQLLEPRDPGITALHAVTLRAVVTAMAG